MKLVWASMVSMGLWALACTGESTDPGTDSGAAGASGIGGSGAVAGQAGKSSTAGTSAAGSGGTVTAGTGNAGMGNAGMGNAGTGNAAGTAAGTAGTGIAGTSSGTGGGNPGDKWDAARNLCLETINMYRATKSLPPLVRNFAQEACADESAEIDAQAKQPHKAFAEGKTCGSFGQNECPGWGPDPLKSLPGCLKQMWEEKNLPACSGCETCEHPYTGCSNCPFQTCGHYLNMKSKKFTKVACGFSDAGWYLQNFAP